MADTNETIADIIAEKRRRADEIERDCAKKMKRGEMVSDCYARELVADIRREANRLEAAHKRELSKNVSKNGADFGQLGDAAKLREAIKAIGGLCDRLMPTWDGSIGRIKDIAEAALAAPPRNCDVGTAKEQVKRWRRFCNSMTTCGECPCHKSYSEVVTDCFSRWAQMPYEEGGAK